MAMTLEVAEDSLMQLEGKRPNSKKYMYDEHIFYKKSFLSAFKETYVCSFSKDQLYKCKVRITRNSSNKLILNLGKNGHEHSPPPDVLLISKMTNEIKKAAQYPGTSRIIYDRVVSQHPKAARSLSFQQATNIITQERKNCWITSKESFESLSIILKSHQHFKDYFQALVEAENQMEGSILIFGDSSVIKRLNNAKTLYFNGNFKVVPTSPKSMQLWNILMTEHGSDKTVLVAFAWCENANHGTYCAVLEYLKNEAPGLEESLKAICTDFEQAALLAYYYKFPNVEIQGCWFHYSQAITKLWNDLNLVEKKKKDDSEKNSQRTAEPWEILFASRNIPLLPENLIEEGLKVIIQLINKRVADWPDLNIFKKYIVDQWLNQPHLLSSFKKTIRTNNKSEAFNRSLLPRIANGHKYPSLGNFLYNMHNIIATEAVKLDQPSRFERQNNQREIENKNERIEKAEKMLERNEISVEDFLFQVMTEDMQKSIMELRIRDVEKETWQSENSEEIAESNNNITLTQKPEVHQPDDGHKKSRKRKIIVNSNMIIHDIKTSPYK